MQLYNSIANSNSKIRIHNFNSRDVAETVRILGLQTACEKLFPKVLSVCCFNAGDDLSVFSNLTRIVSRNCIIRHIPPELDQKVQEIYVKLRELPPNINEFPRRLTSLFLDMEELENIGNIAEDYVIAFDSMNEACPHLQFLCLRFNPRSDNALEEKHKNEVSNLQAINHTGLKKFPSKLNLLLYFCTFQIQVL